MRIFSMTMLTPETDPTGDSAVLQRQAQGKKFKRRLVWGVGGVLGVLVIGAIAIVQSLRPPLTNGWQPLYEGIDMMISPISTDVGKGRMMAIRVKWDTPGIELKHRQPDFPFTQVPWPWKSGYLFRLEVADWALERHKPAIFVNTTRYTPFRPWESYPGNAVATVETLVIDGKASHAHKHSYLLWWDKSGNAHQELTKPPSQEVLDAAVLGIGMQGVSIANGEARPGVMSLVAEPIPRIFMGIDNANKTLYLIGFEEISDAGMVNMAIALGVKDGGMVDSGDASHLLIGEDAKGVRAHTGLRNLRPLAGYLLISADPLEEKPE
jgi:hypothetical protein